MKLDVKDVEAIAKARVMRGESKIFNYWTIGVIASAVIGLFLTKYNNVIGYGIAILGFGGYVWFINNLSNKQNTAKNKLVAEWRQEQKQ